MSKARVKVGQGKGSSVPMSSDVARRFCPIDGGQVFWELDIYYWVCEDCCEMLDTSDLVEYADNVTRRAYEESQNSDSHSPAPSQDEVDAAVASIQTSIQKRRSHE